VPETSRGCLGLPVLPVIIVMVLALAVSAWFQPWNGGRENANARNLLLG
jgi:hypothetical protein